MEPVRERSDCALWGIQGTGAEVDWPTAGGTLEVGRAE